MLTLKVELGRTNYPIWIADGDRALFDRVATLVSDRAPILLTTAKVRRLCLPRLEKSFPSLRILQIPDGERYKNLATVNRIYHQLLRLGADRKTPLLLLGGGVVGDLGGFVAATYLRGLSYLHLPTTLIGQIDSAIGGKVGVNLPAGKNLIGCFYQPLAVASDVSFLKTLPRREIQNGLAEAVKYALIRDPELLSFLLEERGKILRADSETLFKVVGRSARIKSELVSEDEREEKGIRRILNFGHTFGHALERLTLYRRYRHGEAIAIGMVTAAKLSARLGYCSPGLAGNVRQNLVQLGLPTSPPPFSRRQWLEAIRVDKKSEGEMIWFVFLKKIGEVVVEPVAPARLVNFI